MHADRPENYRISVDTGGTFTDAVIVRGTEIVAVGKAPTTYGRLSEGFCGAIEVAANALNMDMRDLLRRTERLVFGTTHAVNALLQRKTAKTALLVTDGFPDVLLFREGGRSEDLLFEYNVEYPDPHIPRRHTFEVPERIDAEGGVTRALDDEPVRMLLRQIRGAGFEAVAVCLIWSVVNPAHELRIGELIEQELPGVPYTLSHQLLRIVREYRRASATAIDASLKPLVQRSLDDLTKDLREWGYEGTILVSTSAGGCVPISQAAEQPVYLLKSGPAMAPVAGRTFERIEDLGPDIIVADTGGTSFDVGLIRAGEIVFTRETWFGPVGTGDLLAMSSVDIRSIGAGGGSIASVDTGGLVNVGPRSAGSEPGPACYGKGGLEPTVTDAAAVLGYLQPDYFLGGRMTLDVEAARMAVTTVADRLSVTPEQAANGIVRVANEAMIDAIRGLTLNVGLDPRENVLVAGGGAAGLNIVPIARELGIRKVLVPRAAGALSACGMQFSDISFQHSASILARSGAFDREAVNAVLDEVEAALDTFVTQAKGEADAIWVKEFRGEARYAGQVWEVDFKLPSDRIRDDADVDATVTAFHEAHERLFTFADDINEIEFINWIGRVNGKFPNTDQLSGVISESAPECEPSALRSAWFDGVEHEISIYNDDVLVPGIDVTGPAIIVAPTSTLVLYPGSSAVVTAANNFLVTIDDL